MHFVCCDNRSWSELWGDILANLQLVCKRRKQPEVAIDFWTSQVVTIRELHGGPGMCQFVSINRFLVCNLNLIFCLKSLSPFEKHNRTPFLLLSLMLEFEYVLHHQPSQQSVFHANIVTRYGKQVWSAGTLSPFVGVLNLNNYLLPRILPWP